MAQSTAQAILWPYVSQRISQQRNHANKVGPYRIAAADIIYRHFDCSNYSACLDMAAIKQWPSFSCKGCRRTQHGTFGDA